MKPVKRSDTRIRLALACAAVGVLHASTGLGDARAADAVRGELLYNTHCVACHTSKMHWRDQRLATDWDSLKVQVRRWQSAIELNWDEDDIASTAYYLNRMYYQFQAPREDKVISGK